MLSEKQQQIMDFPQSGFHTLICDGAVRSGKTSYVNDGHRMDKHYVPGLYVDDDGLLSYDPAGDVGMMVGTKTKYVDGLYYERSRYRKIQGSIRG